MVASEEVVLFVLNVELPVFELIKESVRFWKSETARLRALYFSVTTKALTLNKKYIHLFAFRMMPTDRKKAGISAK